jgi:hypothetical protein
MLRHLALRNRMGTAGRNLARSGAPSPPRRNLSERPSAARGRDQGSWPGACDVALGARPRRDKLAHKRIRNTSRDSDWLSGRSHHPVRGRLDSRLLKLIPRYTQLHISRTSEFRQQHRTPPSQAPVFLVTAQGTSSSRIDHQLLHAGTFLDCPKPRSVASQCAMT